MQVQPPEATNYCPRCGAPIVWTVLPGDGGHQLKVTGYACDCPLTDEEWDALTDEAAGMLELRGGDDARKVRRVAEDPLP